MRSAIVYILLVIYLPVFPGIAEISKLPALISHFLEHKEDNKKIGPLSYLYNHYMMTDDHDGDHQEDEKLPFRSGGTTHTPDMAVFYETKTLPGNYGLATFVQNTVLSFHFQSVPAVIWQPPKA